MSEVLCGFRKSLIKRLDEISPSIIRRLSVVLHFPVRSGDVGGYRGCEAVSDNLTDISTESPYLYLPVMLCTADS